MVNQLGPLAIFFTLSVADLYWPKLYTLLDTSNNLQDWAQLSNGNKKAKLPNDNPSIDSWFFQRSVEFFVKIFLNVEFPTDDHWYQFEWQNQGSGHIHEFL